MAAPPSDAAREYDPSAAAAEEEEDDDDDEEETETAAHADSSAGTRDAARAVPEGSGPWALLLSPLAPPIIQREAAAHSEERAARKAEAVPAVPPREAEPRRARRATPLSRAASTGRKGKGEGEGGGSCGGGPTMAAGSRGWGWILALCPAFRSMAWGSELVWELAGGGGGVASMHTSCTSICTHTLHNPS